MNLMPGDDTSLLSYHASQRLPGQQKHGNMQHTVAITSMMMMMMMMRRCLVPNGFALQPPSLATSHGQMMPTLTCALLPAFALTVAPGLPQHRAREQPSCLASVGCIFLVAQPLSPLRSAIAATAFGGPRGQRSGDSGIGRGGPSVEEHRDKKNHVFFATTVPLQQSLCASLTCREIQVPYVRNDDG